MMLRTVAIVVSCVLFFETSTFSQCPDRDLLRERLLYLRSAGITPKEQQSELLPVFDSLMNCRGGKDSSYILLIRRIGDNYRKLGDYLKAEQFFLEIIRITSDNAGNPKFRQKELITAYFFLTMIYNELNNISEKMKAADSCIAVSMRLKVPYDISCVRSLYSKLVYFFDVGDYQNSIDFASKCEKYALEYANAEKNQDYAQSGWEHAELSLQWRVKALLALKNYDEAEKLLQVKLSEFEKSRNISDLSTIYGFLAEIQLHKGNHNNALKLFNQSLAYSNELGDEFECKQTLKDIGFKIYFKQLKDNKRALEYYKKAISHITGDRDESIRDAFESLDIFANIGNVYVRDGMFDSAYRYFQLAFDQIEPGINERDILKSPPEEFIKHKKIYYLSGLILDKGDAFRRQYESSGQKEHIQKAIAVYKHADQILNRIRAEQTELESKLFWRSDTRRLYESGIEACYLTGDFENAFYFFERSRAVLLNDQLKTQHWIGENDILEQTQVKKRIIQIKSEMENAINPSAQYNSLQAEMDENEIKLDRLLSGIRRKNPLYYQSFLDSTEVSVHDVRQKILNGRQALVELFAGARNVYILVLTQDKIQLKKISKSIFDSLSRTFLHYVSDFKASNAEYQTFVNCARELYNLLFQNIKLPAGRIIISPDGNYFPFEALIISNPAKPIKYFVEDYAVGYTFSARFLLNDFNFNNHERSHDFIGIAPVEYRGEFSLATLPGSEHSLKKLQTYFRDGISFISAQATRNNFLSNYYQYKILQLYTHATDSGHNSEPVIFFADSMLLLSELMYEIEPSTKLVVLSACETGKGKLFQGEGVFSFSRGFAALGIPSSITTLWSVDNKATYELTERFYKHLADGLSIDIALQKAKLEFISSSKENQLPYYWASPILAGQTNAIDVRKSIPWKYFAMASIAIFGILAWWIWNRKRKAIMPIRDTTGIAA